MTSKKGTRIEIEFPERKLMGHPQMRVKLSGVVSWFLNVVRFFWQNWWIPHSPRLLKFDFRKVSTTLRKRASLIGLLSTMEKSDQNRKASKLKTTCANFRIKYRLNKTSRLNIDGDSSVPGVRYKVKWKDCNIIIDTLRPANFPGIWEDVWGALMELKRSVIGVSDLQYTFL